MPEDPEKSGQEPNLELPSLLGFGRKKKKPKTDTAADASTTDKVAEEEPAPTAKRGSAAKSDEPSTTEPVPQPRAGLAPATDRPKRKPPVPPPPATRAEPEVVPEPEPVVAPEPEVVPEPAPEPEVVTAPEVVPEPEPVVEPAPVIEPEPQVSRDTEDTEVVENAPPPASVAAPVDEPPARPVAEPVAEPVTEPVTEEQPVVARGPEFESPQNRPVHEGRVSWNDEEPEAQPQPVAGSVGEPVEEPVAQPRRERTPRELPVINPRLAVAISGGVVGLVGVALTTVAGRGCEVIRGVGSCGGIGLLALLVILVLEILLGAVLLKAWRLTDPTSTSVLGVGLAAVFVMLFLLESLESVWMFLVIPVLSVVTFLVSWLVTETLGESSIDELHR